MSEHYNHAQSLRDQAKLLLRRAEELEALAYKSWAQAEVDKPVKLSAMVNLSDDHVIHIEDNRGLCDFLNWVRSTYSNATSVVITIVL